MWKVQVWRTQIVNNCSVSALKPNQVFHFQFQQAKCVKFKVSFVWDLNLQNGSRPTKLLLNFANYCTHNKGLLSLVKMEANEDNEIDSKQGEIKDVLYRIEITFCSFLKIMF